MRHLCRVVARAGDLILRDCSLDALEVVGIETQIDRSQRLLQLIASARADNWDNVIAARAHPCDRKLRGRCAFGLSKLSQGLHQGEILIQVSRLKARHPDYADVSFGSGIRHTATEQTA